MAKTKQVRQNEKNRKQNASKRSTFRSSIRNVVAAIATGDQQSAIELYQKTLPIIDRMVNKGIIHRNKAARHKSRLTAHIKKLGDKVKGR